MFIMGNPAATIIRQLALRNPVGAASWPLQSDKRNQPHPAGENRPALFLLTRRMEDLSGHTVKEEIREGD